MNKVQLTAQVVECKPLRYTPAGIPVLELTLAHESEPIEGGRPRRVEMLVNAVVVGDLAGRLERSALGRSMRIEGFLAPTRKGSSRLRLHVQQAAVLTREGDGESGQGSTQV
ncbi:MAG: primosomal replication protein N [Pigmentiphaga sp.]|uniref:primosomal replication protein N n=1 Tax=Pigmentiphaga sp. TaxID=1977564 RepID=UPI0029BD6134|nr:primosomal replication protein N [Pigmentiphaga sp.]MDX3905414.1 primosomal replication protein N [Pigmentiphaga sp.]